MEVQALLSPINYQTLDVDLFRLAVNEVIRAPHDQKWSMRTAVRSYLRHAALRFEKYDCDARKVRLVERLCNHWSVRPICSTIPARIWQKYLLKTTCKAYFADAEFGDTRNDQAEIAFAEILLKEMPLKDDRVLPEDLVRVLLGTGRWTTLDFEDGPPTHRGDDWRRGHSPSPSLADALEVYDHEVLTFGVGLFLRRSPLKTGLKNRDGLPVHLGIDRFTVYCGQQVSRAKRTSVRLFDAIGEPLKPAARINWDGRCGPEQGPQCEACRWLEDRLLS